MARSGVAEALAVPVTVTIRTTSALVMGAVSTIATVGTNDRHG